MGTDVEESLSDGMEVDAAADEAASERREGARVQALHVCFYREFVHRAALVLLRTCGLTESEGCCSICVKVRHKGHDAPTRGGRDFCDRGAGVAEASLVLRPRAARLCPRRRRRLAGLADPSTCCAAAAAAAAAASSAAPAAPSLTPSAPDRHWRRRAVVAPQRAELLAVLGEGGAGGFVASLYATYAWQLRQLQKAAPREAPADEEELFDVEGGEREQLRPAVDHRARRPFDVKVKSEVAHHRELRTLSAPA